MLKVRKKKSGIFSWRIVLIISLAAGLLATGMWRSATTSRPGEVLTLTGTTMGTNYAITVHRNIPLSRDRLLGIIEGRLKEINRIFSTWDKTSEVSRINNMPEDKKIRISSEFAHLLTAALDWSEKTGGAMDITVGPLVNLWGFGPVEQTAPPEAEKIDRAMGAIGYRRLIHSEGFLSKELPGMYLDFSAIAKGYAVDALAGELRERGFSDFLVEIGGEIAVAGESVGGGPWRVGIETPVEGAALGEDLIATVGLEGGGLATSGSYRRFKRYREGKSHHIIDPRTGRPANSDLVSVTVHGPDSMSADAVATALMVMGVEAGLEWVEGQKGIEALFLETEGESGFKQHLSSGFSKLIVREFE